jgi:hypothetical protein
MKRIAYLERDMTEEEMEQVRSGFTQNEIFPTRMYLISVRFGYVTPDGQSLIEMLNLKISLNLDIVGLE